MLSSRGLVIASSLLTFSVACSDAQLGAEPAGSAEESAGGSTGATDGAVGAAGGAGISMGGAACAPGQALLPSELLNARDLGGVVLEESTTVACGLLYRGAALASLTAAGCEQLTSMPLRTVIDLRVPAEVESLPDSSCVVDVASRIEAPMPIPYYVSPADYIADLDALESVAAAFEALGDPEAYPIYFHCTYGRDRSGVLAAVVLLALGASREAILAEYQLTAEAGLSAFPASLEAVLDEIEARGGVEAYLEEAGVAAASVATLREVLVAQP